MELEQALDEAVSMSFGEMAFMDAEYDGSPSENVPPGQLVHIEFAPPITGSITLHLPKTTKQGLLENIHGYAWENLTGSEVDDCLMELLNVIAGNYLKLVGDGEHRHAVSLPQMLYDEADIPKLASSLCRSYRVDDELVRVTMTYEKQPHDDEL